MDVILWEFYIYFSTRAEFNEERMSIIMDILCYLCHSGDSDAHEDAVPMPWCLRYNNKLFGFFF